MEATEADDPLFRLTFAGAVLKENILVLDVDAAAGSTDSGVLKETPEFSLLLSSALSGSGNFGEETAALAANVDKLHMRWEAKRKNV